MTVKDGIHFGTGLLVVYLAYKIVDATVNDFCHYAGVDTKLRAWIKHTSNTPKNAKPSSKNTIGFKY